MTSHQLAKLFLENPECCVYVHEPLINKWEEATGLVHIWHDLTGHKIMLYTRDMEYGEEEKFSD